MRKKKVLVCTLLLMLCIASIANIGNSVKGVSSTEISAEINSVLSFSPIKLVVQVGETKDAVATIPMGYGNLYFEESEYCDIVVSGTSIKVTGSKSTEGSDCAVKGTVTPVEISARNPVTISSYLLVEVQK